MALLAPGDAILGMSLDHGGHLTHGAKVNFSGKLYKAAQLRDQTRQREIDYDQVSRLAQEHKPKMIVAGFSAYSRVIDWARFRAIADSSSTAVRGHGARRGLIAAACIRIPCVRGRRDHHHPQDAARAARRTDPGAPERRDPQKAQFDGISGHPGRSLMHVIAAKPWRSWKRCSQSSRLTQPRSSPMRAP